MPDTKLPNYRKPETYINSTQFEALLARVEALEGMLDKKTGLIKRAVDLGIGAPSTLSRWSVEKIESAIAEAEDGKPD
jgi:hypothetical protein